MIITSLSELDFSKIKDFFKNKIKTSNIKKLSFKDIKKPSIIDKDGLDIKTINWFNNYLFECFDHFNDEKDFSLDIIHFITQVIFNKPHENFDMHTYMGCTDVKRKKFYSLTHNLGMFLDNKYFYSGFINILMNIEKCVAETGALDNGSLQMSICPIYYSDGHSCIDVYNRDTLSDYNNEVGIIVKNNKSEYMTSSTRGFFE